MIAGGVTQILECGPGKVLTSLNRRIDKSRDLGMSALADPATLNDALASAAANQRK
jgi:[acyl-carrier-protein] S-malonyltransferase